MLNLEEQYDRIFKYLYYHLHDRHAAEDLTQEAFLRFLYMMVPYLTASWLGSVYERMHRTDQGLGSMLICFLSSAFFAAAPAFFSRLYDERLTFFWAVVFIVTVCSPAWNLREWASNMEEAVWN